MEYTAPQQLQCGFWFILLTSISPFHASLKNKHRRGQTCKLECNWFIWSGKKLSLRSWPYPRAGWCTLLSNDFCAWFIGHPVGFWSVSSCSAGLALKTHTCPWKMTHEVHRRTGDEQNAHSLCFAALSLLSTYYNMNWKMGSLTSIQLTWKIKCQYITASNMPLKRYFKLVNKGPGKIEDSN